MTLRNVPKSFTLEEQRQEFNEIAVDLDTAIDGVQTFGGSKTFSSDVTFQGTVDFDDIATFNSSPTFSDNVVANFGDDADLKIYYDGSVGVLTSFIDSDALQIRSKTDTSELYATALKDGPVELYYDGAKKIATSLTGATVLGDLEVNDELHSASGSFILKTADQITPGQMVTEAVFGGSMYVPYGFSTYPIGDFPGGSINETSTNAGFSVSNGGQIYIANIGGSALWKGRQVGTAGITSEIDAAGNATFGGVLQGDQRVVINGAGGKTGSADTLLNYAGDGSTVTASLTADGAATFAGAVESTSFFKVTNTGIAYLQPNTVTAFQAYESSGPVKISLNNNGSATFAGEVKSTKVSSGANDVLFRGQSDIGQSANSLVDKFVVKSDGSATFAGYGQFGSSTYGYRGILALNNDASGTIYSQNHNSGGAVFEGASTTGSSTSHIYENGSATFAAGTFAIESDGDISTNVRCHGNIELDSTGGFSSPKIQLFSNTGDATFTGSVTASNVSDIRFKENITDANPQLADAVALGSQLKNFDWKDDAPLNEELRAKRFLGLVAQEAEKVCPGLTYTVSRTKQGAELTPETTDEEGNVTPATYEELDDSYKAINHDILVMKLLGAVAEQSTQIETLKTKVESLEASA